MFRTNLERTYCRRGPRPGPGKGIRGIGREFGPSSAMSQCESTTLALQRCLRLRRKMGSTSSSPCLIFRTQDQDCPRIHRLHIRARCSQQPDRHAGGFQRSGQALFRQPEGQRRTHDHVREPGRANQRYALVFRDDLRSDIRIATPPPQLRISCFRTLIDPGNCP